MSPPEQSPARPLLRHVPAVPTTAAAEARVLPLTLPAATIISDWLFCWKHDIWWRKLSAYQRIGTAN